MEGMMAGPARSIAQIYQALNTDVMGEQTRSGIPLLCDPGRNSCMVEASEVHLPSELLKNVREGLLCATKRHQF
jgi:hypothetical protein